MVTRCWPDRVCNLPRGLLTHTRRTFCTKSFADGCFGRSHWRHICNRQCRTCCRCARLWSCCGYHWAQMGLQSHVSHHFGIRALAGMFMVSKSVLPMIDKQLGRTQVQLLCDLRHLLPCITRSWRQHSYRCNHCARVSTS
jgi:hypothetical protein